MRISRAAVAVGYLATTWLFGGRFGLLAGAVVIAGWVLGLPRWTFWATGLLLLAAAPIALMVEGLPGDPVVGADFGTSHLIAHALVGLALAVVGFAGLLELTEGAGFRESHPLQPGSDGGV